MARITCDERHEAPRSTTAPCFRVLFSLWILLIAGITTSHADESFSPDGIPGTLIIVGGGSIPEEVPQALKQATRQGRIVILADAASDPVASAKSATQWLSEYQISDPVIVDSSLPASDRHSQTVAAIESANTVWIGGGQQSQLAEAFAASGVEAALQNLLKRGGTIAGTSAGAAIMSKVMIASGKDQPEIATGWDLLSGSIVDQHFTERNRLGRSQLAIEKHPDHFGLGIDEGTAVFIKGRRMKVTGKGSASILLARTNDRNAEVRQIASGEYADLTQLRRAALQRNSGTNPGEPTGSSVNVPHGSLVIVGGGGMPKDVVDRFVALAGGKSARIVVLPTAVPREETDDRVPGFLKGQEVAEIKVLVQRGDEVDSEEFRSALSSATGIWFGGGRQWNFVDSYEGTTAIELFHDVLRRGGVIGGSSAGATIQGEFLVRGHPLGNTVMMAEGYERGFSFLPGAAIDQHFAQRGRFPDLLPVIQRHPKLMGIGIDEATAIVVTGTKAEVIGQHSAHFLNAKQLAAFSAADGLPTTSEEASKLYITAKSGESVDLTFP